MTDSQSDIPNELAELRDAIDAVDADIVKLLAQRFQLTQQVGELKAKQAMNAFDPTREERKLAQLRALCADTHLDPDLVAELFTRIMQAVVGNHERLKAGSATDS